MRIVTWNMNHGRRSVSQRKKAWDYLRDTLRADVALVQEAVPPAELVSVYRPIDCDSASLNWGSAIAVLGKGLTLHPRKRVPLSECYLTPPAAGELPDSHPGACAVADVLDAGGRRRFTAVSLYGQWEMMPGGKRMFACARVHRMLSDLTGVLSVSRRHPVIVAGDLNLTTQGRNVPSSKPEAAGAEAVFARLAAWNMVDCIAHTRTQRPRLANCTCGDTDSCSHVQTYRHNNRANSNPTQWDYAFASASLIRKKIQCQVVSDPNAWALSDHCPILIELDER